MQPWRATTKLLHLAARPRLNPQTAQILPRISLARLASAETLDTTIEQEARAALRKVAENGSKSRICDLGIYTRQQS